jgi:bis(5'-nucleosyl)-tetraphosphatase (symmetrical)
MSNGLENYRRQIIVGDIHGCLDEFDELLKLLGYGINDNLILVGDLIDRGPDPVGVIRRAREIGAKSVVGNHENRAMLWLKNESLRRDAGRPNNMRPPYDDRRREWEKLSGDDLAWLWRLPHMIRIPGWLISHAGFEPCSPVDDQDMGQLMHIRWVDEGGRHLNSDPTKPDRRPDNSRFWAEAWTGPESIVYGHSVWDEVRRDEPVPGVVCLGIDTGCVYGGKLTAAVLGEGPEPEIVQVQAAREYFSYAKRADG